MKIERIRIEGFGALRDLDLAWPEGRVLLAVDPNETGKTTLCEAIVAALYGLPKTRGAAGRVREVRRPRSGAPLRVGLDVLAGGIRWSVNRDLEVGTIRVMDRDRGLDRTQEFLRPGSRDAFGETVTGGLTEELFRATAYVSQNVLDRDSLDAGLTVELARIADSGGGEASVMRALKTLDAVLLDMPEPAAGAKISVDTEIARLGRRVEGLKQRRADLAARRAVAAQASARLSGCVKAHDEARRTAEIAALAEVLAHRRALARRRETLASALAKQREAESEARALAPEAELFSDGALAAVDRLREERGNRPQVLEAARAAYAESLRLAAREAEETGRRFGPAARLGDAERAGLEEMLRAELATSRDLADAERFLEERWNSLRRDGLAEDFVRLEALPSEDRGFLAGAEEERAALELEGVKLDRRVADAGATAAIAAGERAQRVKLARSLVGGAALLVPFVAWLAWRSAGVPVYMTASVAVFVLSLGLFGGIAWARAIRYRVGDEARAREEEAVSRRKAVELRKQLSNMRLRLDRLARGAGYRDTSSLLKAHRRARAAEEPRRQLVAVTARRDDAKERLQSLGEALRPHRATLSLPEGLPAPEEAEHSLALIADLTRAKQEARTREEVLAREKERLDREEADLSEIEGRLRDAVGRTGAPLSLPLAESLLAVEAGRRKAARLRRLLENELPARRESAGEGEEADLASRLAGLDEEAAGLSAVLEVDPQALTLPDTPEAARREADADRAAMAAADRARASAERELADAAREGGETARTVEEDLATAEAFLARAVLFRDALDLARGTLAAAASSVYGDFRRGLQSASREILATWQTPYEALEFGDDLSLSALVRGGRVATKAEIQSGLSTGAREQLHLTARLAALRYLGTGASGVPLLLDDPLAGADDERFLAVMRFLATDVLGERPVLVVSCHGWRHERLLGALPPEVVRKLTRVSLAPYSTRPGAPGPDGT
jgi:energy-coupling factor transporter ATP-binding protein EcfA2